MTEIGTTQIYLCANKRLVYLNGATLIFIISVLLVTGNLFLTRFFLLNVIMELHSTTLLENSQLKK